MLPLPAAEEATPGCPVKPAARRRAQIGRHALHHPSGSCNEAQLEERLGARKL